MFSSLGFVILDLTFPKKCQSCNLFWEFLDIGCRERPQAYLEIREVGRAGLIEGLAWEINMLAKRIIRMKEM